MSADARSRGRAHPPREQVSRRRAACLDVLDTVIAHAPMGIRGTAVFVLDWDRLRDTAHECSARIDDIVLEEAARRLRSAAPPSHRLLRGDDDEFIVFAQGLVDGNAVLTAAARLVHAYDEALQGADLAPGADVAIGIAFTPQHDAQAESLLFAAEAGLREAMAAARSGARSRPTCCQDVLNCMSSNFSFQNAMRPARSRCSSNGCS